MWQNRQKRWIAVILFAGLAIFLDQWTKVLAVEHIKGQPSESYLGDTFRFVYAENTGAFLSLGSDWSDGWQSIFLQIVPLIVLLGLFAFLLFAKEMPRWIGIAYSLILGGGASNIFDRLMYGHVVDFMNMGIGDLRTGIFNIADVAIMVGLFMILPTMFSRPKKEATPEVDASS